MHASKHILLRPLPLILFIAAAGCGRLSGPEPPLIICDQSSTNGPPSNAGRFGFFASEFYNGYADQVDSLSAVFGVRPAYTLWFQRIDDPFPAGVVTANAARNINTVISLSLESLAADSLRNDTLLKEIARGVWDSVLNVFAGASARCGSLLSLRFGYEMNGYWFPWGGKPEDFKAAWVRAHAVFAQAHAANVRWIFSPNAVYGNQTVSGDIFPYYPGDSVVDAVGLDGYNYGGDYDRWHSWQSFREVFQASLAGIATLGKPVWITETGCPSDPRRPAWLAELFGFMDDNPCVEAVLWFNAHKTGEPDFRMQADSASLSLVQTWLKK